MEKDKHVLVIEDDIDLCGTVVDTLKRAGYKTLGAHTSREAIMKLKNQTYHCILVDIRLGLDSGEDLVEFIRTRKDAMNVETPIVVISGFLDKDLVSRIGKQIQGALVKPFEMKTLVDLVKKHTG
jgi:two-component system, sensor histidine kinase